MQIIMLGTGHGKAINCYNYCFLLKINNTNLLVDSGGSIQIINQLNKMKMSIEDIDNIFISHAHIDHILGLIWIIRFLCPKYYNGLIKKKIHIYGNDDVITKIERTITLFISRDFNFVIEKYFNFVRLVDKQCFNISNIKIRVFDIKSERICEFGFTMKYNNKKIVYLGDERFNKLNEKYITNYDYAFMNARDLKNNENSFHSSIKDSSIIAQKYHIKNLILSHCNDNDLKNRKDIFKEEASKYYNGNIFVPNDLDVINIE